MQTVFYDNSLLQKFPTVRGAFVLATNLDNTIDYDELQNQYTREQRMVSARLQDITLAEIPSINAWRRVFSAFGVKPTQYRNAAEALLRRLSKQGNIPAINPLVDMGNMVSIRHALPIAVFDCRGINGAFGVRLATGTENFSLPSASAPEHPQPGEPVFVDAQNLAASRRWCWRQSAQSAATDITTSVIIAIEGHHEAAQGDVSLAMDDIIALLHEFFAGARVQSGLLSPATPSLTLSMD